MVERVGDSHMIKKTKYIIFLFVIFVFVVGLIIFAFKNSYSLFSKKKQYTYNSDSSQFYISSDLISEFDTQTISFKNYDTNDITFHVYNYSSETQISKTDIEYSIDCSAPVNYYCFVDGSYGMSYPNYLYKDYTCTDHSLTYEQCLYSPTETLLYYKNSNTHTLSLKKRSGASTGNNINVDVRITVFSPYYKMFEYNTFSIDFDSDQGATIIDTKGSNDSFKCEYTIMNYTESSPINLSASSGFFEETKTSTMSFSLGKYEQRKVVLYKTNHNTSCNGIVTIS